MADTSKDGLLLGGGICHVTTTLQLMHRNKQVTAYHIMMNKDVYNIV